MTVAVSIIGVSGWSGIELAKLVAGDARFVLTRAVSDKWKGATLGDRIPGLRGPAARLVVEPQSEAKRAAETSDVVMLATPAEVSAEVAPAVLAIGKRVIDLSGAFRLTDPDVFQTYYGFTHPEPALLGEAHYGLPQVPEASGDAPPIERARLVANPGCYATAAILPLAAILRAGLASPRGLFLDGKSGVTGAGRKLAEKYLFSEVAENLSTYRVATHQHTPEIELALSRVARRDVTVTFAPHLVPMRRGLVVTSFGRLEGAAESGAIDACLHAAYDASDVVRVRGADEIDTQSTWGTGLAVLGGREDRRTDAFVAACAIDNLMKGAASQALENLVRMTIATA
ncbi:MAG TPA: N-acetyl-gamma-glutamyl-phosphate reductase [Polyangiaceae bacterium]|nr:N-acetyl-gamma-glutamyl-phosphate reductase [Polyangiaceae bacterium]